MNKRYFLLFTLLCSFSAFSEDAKKENTAIETVASDDKLNVLMKVPGVKEKFDECKAKPEFKDDLAKLYSDCLWPNLDKKTQDAVQAEYKKTLKTGDNAKIDLTANKTVLKTTFDSANNKGFQKLQEIIGENLKKVLYGDEDPKMMKSADQAKFHEIYKRELSKAIVDVTTTFCLSVDLSNVGTNSDCEKEKTKELKCDEIKDATEKKQCQNSISGQCKDFSISEDKKEQENQQKENLESINKGEFDQVIGYDENKMPIIKGNIISQCIASIPNLCYRGEKQTKQQACVVVDALKAARKNLVLNEEIQKFYKTDEIVSNTSKLDIKNNDSKNISNEEMAKITTVTSKDVEDAYKKTNDELSQKAKECSDNPTLPDCQQFLSTNKSEKEMAVMEFALRQDAQEKELNEALNSDNKDVLKDYLIKLGYGKEEVEKMVADKNSLEEIKKSISDKFKEQKKALIEELSARVSKTTTSDNGKSTDSDKVKYKTVSEELNKKTEVLKGITRFNNIASSYLETKEEGRSPSSSDAKRNTASLNVEVNADKTNKDNQVFQKILKENKANENGSSTFDVKKINEILGLGF